MKALLPIYLSTRCLSTCGGVVRMHVQLPGRGEGEKRNMRVTYREDDSALYWHYVQH